VITSKVTNWPSISTRCDDGRGDMNSTKPPCDPTLGLVVLLLVITILLVLF
jgi:hypothetical protein